MLKDETVDDASKDILNKLLKDMLIEELAELIQALNKFERYEHESGFLANLIEEVADVEIMLTQVKYLLGINERVEHAKFFKIDRQIKRIEWGRTERGDSHDRLRTD
ncbi:MAG: hypothetical protein HXL75_04075 [[Eubacterium] sulci]|nr:hypothetical protein [[Eubacterium] sulci]